MNKYKLTPFKWFVLENFPFIEEDFDALTNWQLFCKIGKEINKIINNENIIGNKVEELSHYLETLDIQEEVNKKLDEMAESGQLAEIIAQYIELKGLLCYNNVAAMKSATNIVDGSFCKTFGKTSLLDGNGRFYKVREIQNTDIIDEVNIIALHNPSLVAVLVPENYLSNIGNLSNLQTTNKSSLVAAINELAEGSSGNLVPFFCVLRATSEGWIILNDSGHEPLNVSSVEISEGRLVIHHNIGNAKVYSCSVTADETYAKYGIKAGASVATNLTRIDLFMSLVANCYWRYQSAQGGLVVQEGFSNLVQSISWDSTKHCVHIVFDNNIAITNPTYWHVEFNANLNAIATQLQRKLVAIYSADGAIDIYMYDNSGNQITTVADFDRINAYYEINKAILPDTLVSHPIANGNLWVAGWLKKLD